MRAEGRVTDHVVEWISIRFRNCRALYVAVSRKPLHVSELKVSNDGERPMDANQGARYHVANRHEYEPIRRQPVATTVS